MGWGILGAAWIAGRAVVPAIAASRNGRLVAVASRDPKRAHAFAARHKIDRVSESYEALLADDDVQAVYIPLVNNLHREWTLRSLAEGKHVLCEKPLALNAREAEEMAAAARSNGRCLMEAFMYRFHPRTRAFIEELQDPLHVHASFGFPLKDGTNYRWQPSLGGGALLDVGCYCVSAARWILGEPDLVLAFATEKAVDTSVGALLRFPSHATASIWGSFESVEVQELQVVTRTGVQRLERPFTSYRDPVDPYQLMVESFADSVMNGRPAAIALDESVANMRVLDRIRAAVTLRPTVS